MLALALTYSFATGFVASPILSILIFEEYSLELGSSSWNQSTNNKTDYVAGFGSVNYNNTESCWNVTGYTNPAGLPIPWTGAFTSTYDHAWTDTVTNSSPYPVVWDAQEISASGFQQFVGLSTGNHFRRGASKDTWNVTEEPG